MTLGFHAALAIAAAKLIACFVFLYVWLPRCLFPRSGLHGFDRFWANFTHMTLVVMLAVQVLALLKIYTVGSFLIVLALIKLGARTWTLGRLPLSEVVAWRHRVIVLFLELLDRRMRLQDPLFSRFRAIGAKIQHAWPSEPGKIMWWGAFVALLVYAVSLRWQALVANLSFNFPDVYVHLLWLKQLRLNEIIDPSWGPYPRGMHSVLLVLSDLTNVDDMYVIGIFGVMISIGLVAVSFYAVYSLTFNYPSALLAAFVFAILTGGPSQSELMPKLVYQSSEYLWQMHLVKWAGLQFMYIPNFAEQPVF
jgi:hypothetical protein